MTREEFEQKAKVAAERQHQEAEYRRIKSAEAKAAEAKRQNQNEGVAESLCNKLVGVIQGTPLHGRILSVTGEPGPFDSHTIRVMLNNQVQVLEVECGGGQYLMRQNGADQAIGIYEGEDETCEAVYAYLHRLTRAGIDGAFDHFRRTQTGK